MTAAHTGHGDGLPITVAGHVLDAQAERCAAQLTIPQIKQAVALAYMYGRHSTEKPPWLKGPRSRNRRDCLYVWPEDQSRCYVVLSKPRELVVVTVLVPNPDSPFAALLRLMTATGLRGPT